MIQLTKRVNSIKPSPTLAVTAKANELKSQGKKILSLGAGEPDFDTPEHIKEAAIQAIKAGFTKYTAVDGIAELKDAIVNKFQRDNNLAYAPKQIVVSCGAKQAIFNLMQAVLDEGDEVVILGPYWVSYTDMAVFCGAKTIVLNSDDTTRFKVSPEQLKAAITPKTKLVMLNSPSNPTGIAYSKAELAEFGKILEQHPNILVATDDIYESIIWNEEGFSNILNATSSLYDRTIVFNGVSKAYSMTGWRIGYAAGPEYIIKAMTKIQSQSTSNPTSISQKASVAALNGSQDCVKEMVVEFKKRHDYLVESINKTQLLKATPADGTFYSFVNAKDAIAALGYKNDSEFAEALLANAGIAAVQGSSFGAEGYLRLSFATSMQVLEACMERLNAFLSGKKINF